MLDLFEGLNKTFEEFYYIFFVKKSTRIYGKRLLFQIFQPLTL